MGNSGNAVRDALTASFSRSYFIDAVEIEREFAIETGRPFSLCLVDVDQLRNINDQFGQRAGDSVLAGVAETVRSTLDLPQWQNLRCLLARFDGDGLILLLPGCRLQRAEQFAHVLRRRVAESRYGDDVAITCSIAVAGYTVGDTVDALLGRIERTLHLGKQFGNDSVEIAQTPEPRQHSAKVTRLPVQWRGPRDRSA